MSTRNYFDPIYNSISLDSSKAEERMVIKLIDSYPFQRLRRIKQLGPASLTFHGAESSRFNHSLGVFHLARRSLNILIKSNPHLKEFRYLLYGSALLHDLGHGPLSHTSEEAFGFKHEYWTAKLIREQADISNPLENFKEGSSNQIADLIEFSRSPNKAILSIVSSQLDCDRLDYLLRDSHTTGTKYGQIDLERILSAITIAPDGDLAINPKGIMAVEHYLVIRNIMYRSIYNHRLNEVCNWLLERIIETARRLGPSKVWADEYMSKWLWEKESVNAKVFLANDDILTGYHLFRWGEESPKPLNQLCKRLLNRNLLKALDIGNFKNELQLEALAMARRITKKSGSDPDSCCGLRTHKSYGYHPYKGGLRTWDGVNLRALEKSSNLIKSLIEPYKSAWLIFPKEIEIELSLELKNINDNLII